MLIVFLCLLHSSAQQMLVESINEQMNKASTDSQGVPQRFDAQYRHQVLVGRCRGGRGQRRRPSLEALQ